MPDWVKLIPFAAIVGLLGIPLKHLLDDRRAGREKRSGPYRAILSNERAILNGLDAWSFDSRQEPPAEAVEGRRNRPPLDDGLVGVASPKVAGLENAVQDASDVYWHVIQEHAAVWRDSRADLGPAFALVREKKAEAHAAYRRLERRVRRELSWP